VEASAVILLSKSVTLALGAMTLIAGLFGATVAMAQQSPEVAGKIDWGIWIDDDGCMHWWADGGVEGYMIDRVDPKTGKPVCLKRNTCLVENSDQLFATNSAQLTTDGRRRLKEFFSNEGAFGYAIYGHTDSRASEDYNLRLSDRRAGAVAKVARSAGAVVEREIGFGERYPIASNDTAAGMKQNRRVEVVCYRW
jgi:outer membrane protein OmpA-like peptidoglycan-associated protein